MTAPSLEKQVVDFVEVWHKWKRARSVATQTANEKKLFQMAENAIKNANYETWLKELDKQLANPVAKKSGKP